MDLIEKRAVNPLCAEVFKKSGNTSFRTDKPHISRCDATGIKGADTIRIMFVPTCNNGNEILLIRMYLFNCGQENCRRSLFLRLSSYKDWQRRVCRPPHRCQIPTGRQSGRAIALRSRSLR